MKTATDTLISDDGLHDEDVMSNSPLQISLSQNEELTSFEPHSAPFLESE